MILIIWLLIKIYICRRAEEIKEKTTYPDYLGSRRHWGGNHFRFRRPSWIRTLKIIYHIIVLRKCFSEIRFLWSSPLYPIYILVQLMKTCLDHVNYISLHYSTTNEIKIVCQNCHPVGCIGLIQKSPSSVHLYTIQSVTM